VPGRFPLETLLLENGFGIQQKSTKVTPNALMKESTRLVNNINKPTDIGKMFAFFI
jgi:hypothetical protein